MKRTLLFTAIMSILTLNAYATSATVTSRDYVDAQDALKQNTIPATGTNASTPGSTVVTYTSTAGTIGERGILEPNALYDSSTDANKLLTAGQLGDFAVYVDEQIQNIQNNMPDFDDLPETTVTYKTCTEWVAGQSHTDENCLLWQLVDKNVYGRCNSDSDCVWLDCSNNPNAPYSSCNRAIGQCGCGGGR